MENDYTLILNSLGSIEIMIILFILAIIIMAPIITLGVYLIKRNKK